MEYRKRPPAGGCSLERVVRPAPTEQTNVMARPTGGGARALPPERGDRSERRASKANRKHEAGRTGTGVAWRTGTRVPLANREGETQGLTNSSSATGTGDARLNQQKRRERRCLFAGARG